MSHGLHRVVESQSRRRNSEEKNNDNTEDDKSPNVSVGILVIVNSHRTLAAHSTGKCGGIRCRGSSAQQRRVEQEEGNDHRVGQHPVEEDVDLVHGFDGVDEAVDGGAQQHPGADLDHGVHQRLVDEDGDSTRAQTQNNHLQRDGQLLTTKNATGGSRWIRNGHTE